MLKRALTAFIFPLFLFFGNSSVSSAAPPIQKTSDAPTGTLQKMIVESGTATMELDLNRLNGISTATRKRQQLRFVVAANSFLPILVFNDLLRGLEPGSMALIPQSPQSAGTADLKTW